MIVRAQYKGIVLTTSTLPRDLLLLLAAGLNSFYNNYGTKLLTILYPMWDLATYVGLGNCGTWQQFVHVSSCNHYNHCISL